MLAIALAIAATAPWTLVSSAPRVAVQNVLFDQYQRWLPRPPLETSPVRIVEIDDASIVKLGRWPWPRSRIAALVDRVAGGRPAAIAIDLLFNDVEDGADDAALAKSFAGRPVVIGQFLTHSAVSNGERFAKAGFSWAGDDPLQFIPRFKAKLAPLPAFARAAAGLGFVNWEPDSDRVVRRVPLVLNVGGDLVPSLAMEALRVAQGASTYLIRSSNASGEDAFGAKTGVNAIRNGDAAIPTEARGELRIRYAPDSSLRRLSASDALDESFDASQFAGSIVLIGLTASLQADLVGTPLSPASPGVEEHAQILDQVLAQDFLTRPDWAPGAEFLSTLLASLVLAVALPLLNTLGAAAFGGVVSAGSALVSWWAFSRYGLLIDPIIPSFGSGLVFLTGALMLYGRKKGEEREIRAAFGRYVAPAVVAKLAANRSLLRLGGEERVVTLMFTDLRAFTSLSERMSATELTTFLNEYLTPMTDIVLGVGGTVDKYIGDAIMAFWNAPIDDPRHAAHAVGAALQMRAALTGLNGRWRREAERAGAAFEEVRFGVGLNTGQCCVGNLGSLRRFDYSVIGDEVNVASRLESCSKMFGVDIVASDATRAEAVEFAWLEIDFVIFKNKTKPITVYALIGDAEYAASPAFTALSLAHDRMMKAYRDREFAVAQAEAQELAERGPEIARGLYAFQARRFAALAAEAPAEDWRALIVLDEK